MSQDTSCQSVSDVGDLGLGYLAITVGLLLFNCHLRTAALKIGEFAYGRGLNVGSCLLLSQIIGSSSSVLSYTGWQGLSKISE